MEPRAVARKGDPQTSWDAARSIASERIRDSQRAVWVALQNGGPMTDVELVERVEGQSVSGIRTRRSELVAMGLVRDSGKRKRGPSGRMMIVWTVGEVDVDEGRYRRVEREGKPDQYIDLRKAQADDAQRELVNARLREDGRLRATPRHTSLPFGVRVCPRCHGTGGNMKDACTRCAGEGWIA